jgi:hypothetical protein
MPTIEDQPFVYADLLYDPSTEEYGYRLATLQEDGSYDVTPARYGFSTLERVMNSGQGIGRVEQNEQPSR